MDGIEIVDIFVFKNFIEKLIQIILLWIGAEILLIICCLIE